MYGRTYTQDLQARAEGELLDRLYEEAQEDGELHWMGATRVDPGCWSHEIDLDMETLVVTAEDDEDSLTGDDLHARFTAYIGRSIFFQGEAGFRVNRDGYLVLSTMESL